MNKLKASSAALSRRRFLQVAGLGGLVTAISACSSSAPAAPTDAPDIPTSAPLAPPPTRAPESSAPKANASSSQVTPNATSVKPPFDASRASVWITIAAPSFCDLFDTMTEGFAKDTGGTRINAVQCDWADANDNFALVLKSRMTQPQPPDAIVLNGFTPDLVAADVLEPLDDLMQSSTFSNANAWPTALLNTAVVQGKTYGLPLMVAPYAMYYNAGAFEKKGLSAKREDFPKTLEDLKRISKQFTNWNGDTLGSAGFLPGLKGSDLPLWFALNGGGLFDAAKNKFVVDQDRNIEILQFILDWYKDEYHGVAAKARDTLDFQSGDSTSDTPKAFQRGALAMTSASLFASDTLSRLSLPDDAKNWNVAPFPVGPSGKDSTTFAITAWAVLPKNAKHRDDAFKYVDYVGGKGAADPLAFEFGAFVPGNKTIATPAGSKAVTQARGEAFTADWLAFFLKQRDIATTFDTSPIAGFASDVLGLQMDDVLRGKGTPTEALRQTQKLCQDKFEQTTKKN